MVQNGAEGSGRDAGPNWRFQLIEVGEQEAERILQPSAVSAGADGHLEAWKGDEHEPSQRTRAPGALHRTLRLAARDRTCQRILDELQIRLDATADIGVLGRELEGLVDAQAAMAIARRAGIGDDAAEEGLDGLTGRAGVEPMVVQSENARSALALVSAGEAPFGIVYGSDAVADGRVTVIGTFPPDSHQPIAYPAALLTGAADAADRAFFDALSADAADAIFRQQGFSIQN